MWLRLRFADLRIIAHYVGLFVVGIGVVMVVPLVNGPGVSRVGSRARLRR